MVVSCISHNFMPAVGAQIAMVVPCISFSLLPAGGTGSDGCSMLFVQLDVRIGHRSQLFPENSSNTKINQYRS